MPTPKPSRKSRFRAALALADMTAEQWAEANGITAGHLSHVLTGARPSESLYKKIDAFADRFLKDTVAA